jgi:phage antirepressor YoqD-like protein
MNPGSKFKTLIQAGITSEGIHAIMNAASNLTMCEEAELDRFQVKEIYEFHCDHITQSIIEGLGLPQDEV